MSLTFLIIPTLVHGPRFTKIIKNILDFFENSYLKSTVHGSQKKFEKCLWFFWEFLSEVHGPRFTVHKKIIPGNFDFNFLYGISQMLHTIVHGPRFTKIIKNVLDFFENSYLKFTVYGTQKKNLKNVPDFFENFYLKYTVHGSQKYKKCLWLFW